MVDLARLVPTTLAAWLVASAAHAVNISLDTPHAAPSPASRSAPTKPPPPTVRVTGMFETGDADKLRQVLDQIAGRRDPKSDGPAAVIELSSMGGSLTEGFEIGFLFRKRRVITVVRRQDFCLSSCALAFLGGGNSGGNPFTRPGECNIEIGGKVAFHNFWLNRNGLREVTAADPVASRLQGFTDARGGAAQLVRYAGEMGLPPNFVASLMGRPVEDFQYIETVGQFLSFHVCPIGLARPASRPEAQAANVCLNSLGVAQAPGELRATTIPADKAKLYLLERVQEGMQSSKAKGRLAAQLASGAVMRVKEEIDKLYDDLRAAGVALPEIVGPTYEIGSSRGNAYEPLCYVSLSSDNPDLFDVSVRGSRGLAEPPRSPPDNARRLFLFDRDAKINPKP